ncbi:MAG: hypothetical protein E7662_01600 [Ruminococcaceae bacterium]|nr:hypothetical protein [Oscillospiraceae bacterium]
MRTVNFFGKSVTKLAIGDNPFNGHSYIEDVTPGREMVQFYTAEKIKETLFELESCGYNTMTPLADPYIIRLLQEYEREGGKMQYIFQPFMAMNQDVSIRAMMTLNTIGIYHQGTTTDNLYERGQCDQIHAMLKKYHTMGIPVGLGTHRPDVIEKSEREGWEVDFYMACMQNARRNREGEPSGFITGKTKSNLVFYPEDRPVMLDCLKKVTKPIIAFKIFAGGQMFLKATPEQKKQLIKGAYNEVFTALKPDDFATVGVFQRDSNQARENAELFNEWDAETNGAR